MAPKRACSVSAEHRIADDHRLAADLAHRAGELLVELRARLVGEGAPTALLRAEGDRQAHEMLAAELAAARPGDAVLSEEGADDTARLDAERVWVVDPLDGTREFSEPGRTDWAVHVALVVGERPVAGAVALPALEADPVDGEPAPASRGPNRPTPAGRVAFTPPAPGRGRSRRARRGGSPAGLSRRQVDGRGSQAMPTSTSMPAASTSGTPVRPRPWPPRPDARRAASTARTCATTRPTPICPTW